MKRGISLILCALLLAAVFSFPGCRKTGGGVPFSVLAAPDDPNTRIDVWFDEKNDRYCLFLPADTDPGALTVLCGKNCVEIDGEKLADGETTAVFNGKKTAVLRAGQEECTLIVSRSENVPAVFINTQSGSLDAVHADKSHKEPAVFTLREDGETTVDAAPLAYIKGRGGSTWLNYSKKPYNIKFEDKTDLLGMGSAKKWALLADAQSYAYIKEPVAMELARKMSFAYTPESRHVDLYVNGTYLGLYRISEKAEVGGQRLDIRDLDDANEAGNPDLSASSVPYRVVRADGSSSDGTAELRAGDRREKAWPNEPQDISAGYLLELTDCDKGACGFRTARGFYIELTSPEYATAGEAALIAALYADAEDALFSPDGRNGKGRSYTDYFDPVSFADMYLLREFMMDHDAGCRSVFFYKPGDGETLYAGPVWDMNAVFALDYTMLGASLNDPATLWIAANCYFSETATGDAPTLDGILPSLFTALYRHEDFRETVAERWTELSPLFDGAAERAAALRKTLLAASLADRLRWGAPADETDLAALTDFMTKRKAALDRAFSADGAMLYYDAGEGDGFAVGQQCLAVGDAAVLKNICEKPREQLLRSIENGVSALSQIDSTISPPAEGYVFAGWSAAPDGSGERYQPGDEYILTEKTNVLYAQWERK